MRVHRGRAAGRGAARARLLRPRPLALLAVRPGRLARRGALGRPARPLDAHHGQGQERLARRGRRPRAGGARDRRGAGRRGRRPARRQHRRRGARSWSTSTAPTPPGSRSSPRASTSTCSRPATRARPGPGSGSPADAVVLLFVGRIQPLKAPDVLLRAAARLLERDPSLRERLVVAVVGGPSRHRPGAPRGTSPSSPARSASATLVRFEPPVAAAGARRLVPRRDVVRRPVVQRVLRAGRARGAGLRHARSSPRAVGGLRTAVADGQSGLLVDGHDPPDWADGARPAASPTRSRREALCAAAAVEHAARVRLGRRPAAATARRSTADGADQRATPPTARTR